LNGLMMAVTNFMMSPDKCRKTAGQSAQPNPPGLKQS
jgi:hypothetical protein